MIASEIKVDPGGGLVQIVVHRRDQVLAKRLICAVRLESLVGEYVYAFALVGICFAPSLAASAARTIALILGALAHGAQIGQLQHGAIAAVPALVSQTFDDLFAFRKCALQCGSVHHRSEERRVGKECRSRWSPY